MAFKEMSFEERCRKREELFNLNSPEMESLKIQASAARSGGECLHLALEMSDEARRLAFRALQKENPLWTANELMVEYFRWVFFPQPLPPDAVNAVLKHPYNRSADQMAM